MAIDTAASEATMQPAHPLESLTAAEIETATAVLRDSGRLTEAARFAYFGLDEPPKETVAGFAPGDPVDRRVRVVIVPGPGAEVVEAVVDANARAVESFREVPETRPALLFEESYGAIVALRENAEWQAALARRGITDQTKVQIDPWPAGNFGLAHEDGRRISRCIAYYRENKTDNGYARPIEGLVGVVDIGRGEVLEVADYGVVPIPPERGGYLHDDVAPHRDDLKPIEITQPDGPSFTVDGNLVRWQRWSMRLSMDPYEGLVLHTVGYEDAGRVRPILHRASVSEMVVPYAHAGPMHNWKNAFDIGEWGLGRMANSLTLGCDCLGVIHYFDATLGNEKGEPYTIRNAICMHEEDYGIVWKHVDLQGGTTEVRRQRRLVVSSIATVGNYEYGFYWYFYLDGSMQLEVKLTGVMSTMALSDGDGLGDERGSAAMIAPQLAAPYHQHLFNVRLDFDVDGTSNTVYEVDSVPVPAGPANPLRNVFTTVATPLTTEQQAQRMVDAARSRVWKIVNPAVRNRLGEPVGYKLVPSSTPTLLADPESSVGRRAAFATRNTWVTPYRADERRAAGDHPNQHGGGDGLPRWTAADRPIADTDVVVWHTFGVTHIPRPEDWPVMPVESTGFLLAPVGFFDRNPALDVPPSPGHSDDGGT
ncbi:MAG TPA: primary-amine oxidase [Acidimicrobiia bacterium]|nr:primary-amine oxidase [Acidimicrobiia bacterium]